MADKRPRVTVDKTVNLAQLDREMGSPGLSAALDADDAVAEVVAPESVTPADLQAAVDAHEASFAPDPDAELDAGLAEVAARDDVPDWGQALLDQLRGQGGHQGRAAGRPTQ